MPEPWLPADHGTEQEGLRRKVAHGLTWTFIHTWGGQGLSLLVFLVLARLLTPSQFGLVALAAVFVALAQLVIDQGFGDAIIQRPTVTRGHIDTAFWVAVATGTLLAIIGVLAAGPLSVLLDEPRLTPILQVLSLLFIVSSLGSTQQALLRRELAFRSLATRGLLALAGGGAVGIVMAFLNFGAWALVGQQIAAALIGVVTLWTISPWRPGLEVSRQNFVELFNFGIKVVGSDVLTFLSRNTDNLLIGVFLGSRLLGIYAVAYRILDTSQKVLVSVSRRLAFPALSKLQGDPERMKRAYLKLTRIAGSAILPGYVGLALVAPEMTVFLFGFKWQDAGPVASILFLIGPVLSMQAFSTSLLTAAGYPDVVFRFRLITTVTNVVGFIIAVQFGKDILWVAVAYSVRGYLLLPLNLSWQNRYGGINTREYLAQLKGTILATLAMTAAVLGIKFGLGSRVGNSMLLLLEVVTAAIVFVAVMWIANRTLLYEMLRVGRQSIPGINRLGRLFTSRRRAAAASREPAAEAKADALSPSTRGEE
ncbi:MAG TPA: lipopolysaccharide biosynthesis protein [Candidatus Limnocylindria bacterium]|nr:lipopolysaccharide biosynthesis protein [Candidatus Limnocylindria bacterium]